MKQLLIACLLLIGYQGQAQTLKRVPWRTITGTGSSTVTTPSTNTNIVTITATYTTAPTSPTANFSALKYNKQAWFSYERDDQISAVNGSAWNDFAFMTGGTDLLGNTYPGKTFTDGAGNLVKWRAGVAVNARNNNNNNSLWGSTAKLTTSQVATMVQNDWSVLNHGFYHELDTISDAGKPLTSVNFWPAGPTASYSRAGWNIAKNERFTDSLLTLAGVRYLTRVVVRPSAWVGYVRAADSLQYLGVTTTGTVEASYYNIPTSTGLNAGGSSTNFIWEENLPTNYSRFGNTGFLQLLRLFPADPWSSSTLTTLKAQFADMLSKSSDTKHLGMRLATHVNTYDQMQDFCNYIDNLAQDRVWFVGAHEYFEYREVKQRAQKSQSLFGNVLTVTIDLSNIPEKNRYRDMSLILSGGTLSSVTVQGADSYSVNLVTGLVNVFKKKTTGFAANYNTPTFPSGTTLSIVGSSTVAEGTSQTYSIIATYPNSLTQNVTEVATFTASRGTLSGRTLSNPANQLLGDDKITTLRAACGPLSTSREITFTDATSGYNTFVARTVNSSDIASYPQMKLGDLIVPGPNKVNAATGEYAIRIEKNYNNLPSLAPGATVWIAGSSYTDIILDLSLSKNNNTNPVRVSNYNGQVKVLNTLWFFGAVGTKLTGRYVAGVSGDADYVGHANGYTFTAGRYGFLFDNQWSNPEKAAIRADSGSMYLEVEYGEFTGGYFTAALLNDNNRVPGSTAYTPYRGFRWHDTYVHGLDGEGLYIGKTDQEYRAIVEDIEIYNNRILECGNESIQLGQLRKRARVYNNVCSAALRRRDPFQRNQDNNLQLYGFGGDWQVYKNIFIGYGEKGFQILTKADSAGYSTASTDSVIIRKNAFVFGSGGWNGYAITQNALGTGNKSPINNLSLLIDNNLFGKSNYTYNQYYNITAFPSGSLQGYALKTELYGENVNVFVTNNTIDNSIIKSSLINFSGMGSLSFYDNALNSSFAEPVFENYIGIPGYDLSRIEAWSPSVASTTSNPAGLMLVGVPITVPVGDIRVHKGKYYMSKATGNTAIEPGVAPNWQTYWDIMYWNKSTGMPVYSPSNTSGLSSIPAHNMKAGGIYAQMGNL